MHHHLVASTLTVANRFFLTALIASLITLAGATRSLALDQLTSLVSLNTASYIESAIVLPNGNGVMFSTQDSLSAADTDDQPDVYLNKDGVITFLTPGLAESVGLSLKGASDDGSKFFVETTGRLDFTVDDDGSGTDIYRVVNGAAELVSRYDAALVDNQSNFMRFEGNSADASRAYFTTDGQMNPADLDGGGVDVYERDITGGETKLISIDTAAAADATVDAEFCGASANGSVVAFDTPEPLEASDLDSGANDAYMRVGSITSLVSTGPLGASVAGESQCMGVSSDGTTIAFDSKAKLFTDDDSTSHWDVFTRSGSATRWVSTSPLSISTIFDARFADMTGDGLIVHFNTAEKLVAEDAGPDTDDNDGYSSRPGGIITLETGGSLAADEGGAQTVGVSSDGKSVLFTTNDKYVAEDTDEEESDLYLNVEGAGRFLASTGPADLDGPFGNQRLFANDPNHRWTMSADGRSVGFSTFGRLVSADTDLESDVYLFSLREPAAPPAPPAGDTIAPVISAAKLSNKSFAIDKKIKALSVSKAKKGTKISFSLNEAATVKLAFSSVKSGKRKLVKTAKRSGTTGANSVKFGGKIGSKTLAAGKYELKLTATDASGNVSNPKTLKFTIVH